ncbi:hypothetical protein IW261DRAFT_1004093 [Armillaria novae-zelandiae]|uniref:F-box domain-containing protein n=1 Tax=Armillaria novae-zelandiae TaxID=153914 RepID=A0AA39T7U8_9AGAR|nr:hypothetical protein IW261DRAFT_1004093 [Armillaria novae-zelandiae]
MNVTNLLFHLDAAAQSVPDPTFPPDPLNSDVSDILRATRPFLDTDRDWIIPNIEDLRRQVSVYDNLLNRIDEIRSKVQRRHDAVQKAMVVYSSTLAPVRHLPVDVLRSVFRKIQVSEWRTTSSHTPNFSQGPWTLSHVCGAWRDVVLSYPQLWSHIKLRYWYPRSEINRLAEVDSPPRHLLVALKAMILRSEQCPLDIVLQLDLDHDVDMVEEIFAMILEVSHRWRTLELQMSSNLLERLKMVHGRIPCLESLTLGSWETFQVGRAEPADDIRTLFADAPCIRNITLPLHGIYGLGDFVFPLHITHLAAPVENVANLGAYQSLVECHLGIKYGPNGSNSDISLPLHIFLPNVRRLFVRSIQILAHLCLPSLNHLTIAGVEIIVRRYVQVVNDFLRRSRCSLTRLAFYSTDGDDQSLIEDSLLFMETVVCLEVALSDDDDIFNALTSDKFLPNLQHLRLFSFGTHSSQDLLTDMISSRRRHLRSVMISCSSDDVGSINQQLAQIQQPGQHFIAIPRELEDTGSWQYGNFNLTNLDDVVDQ